MSPEQIIALMRPLIVRLERALVRLQEAGVPVPTVPVPRIESARDGSGRQWTETEVDFRRLRLETSAALEHGAEMGTAEAVIAHALGTEHDAVVGSDRAWTPQGQVVDVFLEEYLRRAYGDLGNLHLPNALAMEDPPELALRTEADRLSQFLRRDAYTGRLIVPLSGVRLPSPVIQLEAGLAITVFTEAWRDELWGTAGWGSPATQPLQFHDFSDIGWAAVAEVPGAHLGGWDWATAQPRIERVVLALLIAGATGVSTPFSWLRLDDEFAPYLARLGAGAGLVRQLPPQRVSARSSLSAEEAGELPSIVSSLASVPAAGTLPLALRRLRLSAERNSPEDRLIDAWIAFEALFAPDGSTELSFRASLRIARYVGRDVAERRSLFTALRRAYEWRSHVVHGSPLEKAKTSRIGTLEEAISTSEQALRAALRGWIKAPPDLSEIDRRFLA